MPEPLVSIGIPTYNRAKRLRRAAESVLGQTHRNLTLVISDDASTDDTAALLAELSTRDARVRVLEAPVNRGLSSNFNTVYAALDGQYVMTLSDDDWLAPDYIERCLAALDEDTVLACGTARYLDGTGRVVHVGRKSNFTSSDPRTRVRMYLDGVDENGILYGLMPHEVLRRASPMRNVMANDWLVVASVLVQGKAVTLDETSLFRDVGGTSDSISKLVRTLRLPPWQARVPAFVMAWEVAAEIGWRGSAFKHLGRWHRISLAVTAAVGSINWRSVLWHALRG